MRGVDRDALIGVAEMMLPAPVALPPMVLFCGPLKISMPAKPFGERRRAAAVEADIISLDEIPICPDVADEDALHRVPGDHVAAPLRSCRR